MQGSPPGLAEGNPPEFSALALLVISIGITTEQNEVVIPILPTPNPSGGGDLKNARFSPGARRRQPPGIFI